MISELPLTLDGSFQGEDPTQLFSTQVTIETHGVEIVVRNADGTVLTTVLIDAGGEDLMMHTWSTEDYVRGDAPTTSAFLAKTNPAQGELDATKLYDTLEEAIRFAREQKCVGVEAISSTHPCKLVVLLNEYGKPSHFTIEGVEGNCTPTRSVSSLRTVKVYAAPYQVNGWRIILPR